MFFFLNLNGIYVLTMFKKSYFLKWDSPLRALQTNFTTVRLNFATHPWKSTCCCAIIYSAYKQHTRPWCMQTYFLNCFLTYNLFPKKNTKDNHLSTFTFLICRLPVTYIVYKERWWNWHKLVTDLFYDFASILLV